MSTKLGSVVFAQLGARKLSIILINGVSAIQGLLEYWKDSQGFWKYL